ADHQRLLDWGFEHYPLQTIVEEGRKIAGYSLAAGSAFRYPLAEGERGRISTRLAVRAQDDIRLWLGDAGRLELLLDGVPIGSVPLKLLEQPGDSGRRPDRSAASKGAFTPQPEARPAARSLLDALRTVGLTLLMRGV